MAGRLRCTECSINFKVDCSELCFPICLACRIAELLVQGLGLAVGIVLIADVLLGHSLVSVL